LQLGSYYRYLNRIPKPFNSMLADPVVLAAMRQRDNPRATRPEEVVRDPVFADIYDRCTKRGSEKK
jgi:hypothetical protein